MIEKLNGFDTLKINLSSRNQESIEIFDVSSGSYQIQYDGKTYSLYETGDPSELLAEGFTNFKDVVGEILEKNDVKEKLFNEIKEKEKIGFSLDDENNLQLKNLLVMNSR